MAWLKFDTATPEKPEVMAIAIALGFDDPDLVVGKLLKVWRWFDQHTVEGNANGVTAALLDRMIGVPGMCAAMASVGWLVVSETGLELPNFERHNGKTAKDRALTAQRVAKAKTKAKSNEQGNASTVTAPLPREEKRREENSSSLRSEEGVRASRLPADWQLPDSWREWATAERPDLDMQRAAAGFADYWRAKPGKDGRKTDWFATWRNWVRNERAPPQARASPPAAKHAAAARAIYGAPDTQEYIDVETVVRQH